MARHLLTLLALGSLWAVPVSAQRGAAASDSKWHSSDCKAARAQERVQAPAAKAPAAQTPPAEASGGSFLSHGWLSFFARPSSPLLP